MYTIFVYICSDYKSKTLFMLHFDFFSSNTNIFIELTNLKTISEIYTYLLINKHIFFTDM